jgi:GTPase involved in cell partitioning and DNA repair
MAERDEIIVLNKTDLPEVRKRLPALQKLFARRKLSLHGVSAVTGDGLKQVLELAWQAVARVSGR